MLQNGEKTNMMETRKHIAAERKRCGSHNCAQAILGTYADKVGIDEETARNIAVSSQFLPYCA